jgi:hypothetical protein
MLEIIKEPAVKSIAIFGGDDFISVMILTVQSNTPLMASLNMFAVLVDQVLQDRFSEHC